VPLQLLRAETVPISYNDAWRNETCKNRAAHCGNRSFADFARSAIVTDALHRLLFTSVQTSPKDVRQRLCLKTTHKREGTDAAFRERETTNAKRLVFDAAKTQMLVFALRLARGDSPKRRAF